MDWKPPTAWMGWYWYDFNFKRGVVRERGLAAPIFCELKFCASNLYVLYWYPSRISMYQYVMCFFVRRTPRVYIMTIYDDQWWMVHHGHADRFGLSCLLCPASATPRMGNIWPSVRVCFAGNAELKEAGHHIFPVGTVEHEHAGTLQPAWVLWCDPVKSSVVMSYDAFTIIHDPMISSQDVRLRRKPVRVKCEVLYSADSGFINTSFAAPLLLFSGSHYFIFYQVMP